MSRELYKIVSSIRGRLRLKLSPEIANQLFPLQQRLLQLPAIAEIDLNATARSLTLYYAAEVSIAEMETQLRTKLQQLIGPLSMPVAEQAEAVMAETVSKPLPSRARKHARRRDINRLAKTAALVTLPLSIALVYGGNKRWHAITGWGFVAAMATHIFIHRKNTFR